MPELFSGEGSWDDWIDHFESVTAVNSWDDAKKLDLVDWVGAYGIQAIVGGNPY